MIKKLSYKTFKYAVVSKELIVIEKINLPRAFASVILYFQIFCITECHIQPPPPPLPPPKKKKEKNGYGQKVSDFKYLIAEGKYKKRKKNLTMK